MDAPLAPATPRTLPPWMPLLVVAVAWAAQGGVLRNGWVWDDAILIRDGAAVGRGFAGIPDLLRGTWGSGDGIEVGLFRPLVGASLALQAGLHGTADPFPFHLANLLLHGLAAVLLLAVAHRLLPRRPVVAATAALLFAAHPLHTGTVSWIVARGDLLATVFALATVLVWTRTRGLDLAAAVLAGTLYLLALLSKEAAAPLPLVLLLVDAGARGEGVRRAFASRWTGWVALVVAVGAWAFVRAAAGDPAALAANAPLASRPWLDRAMVGAGALVRMAAKVAVPAGLVGDASNDPVLVRTATLPAAYAAATALVAFVALVLAVRAATRRAGVVDFCLASFAVLALPVLQLIPLGAVFEDRFAYLPSVALLPLAGLAVERLLATRFPRVALVGCGVVLAALLPASWAVAADWRDDAAFDAALLEADPGHVRALDRSARRALLEAIDARRRAEALPVSRQPEIDAWQTRRRERVEAAIRLLERARTLAVEQGRRSASVLRTLGDAYLQLPARNAAAAKAAYEQHLDARRVLSGGRRLRVADVTDPDTVPWSERRSLAQVYQNLEIAHGLLEPDDLPTRAALLDRAAWWDPRSFTLARGAAGAWNLVREPAQALRHLERALALALADPSIPADERATVARNIEEAKARLADGPDAELARGREAASKAGGHVEALAHFEEAVRLRPDFVEAWVEIAAIHKWKGNFRDAYAALDRAVAGLDAARAKPDDPRRERLSRLRALYERAQREADARERDGK